MKTQNMSYTNAALRSADATLIFGKRAI